MKKRFLLSNPEAKLGPGAPVITPLKFRKLFRQTVLKTGPESKRDKGDDKQRTGRLFVDQVASQKEKKTCDVTEDKAL